MGLVKQVAQGLTDRLLDRLDRAAAARSSAEACPSCGAGPERRIESNGFGATFERICGACGHSFGEESR